MKKENLVSLDSFLTEEADSALCTLEVFLVAQHAYVLAFWVSLVFAARSLTGSLPALRQALSLSFFSRTRLLAIARCEPPVMSV